MKKAPVSHGALVRLTVRVANPDFRLCGSVGSIAPAVGAVKRGTVSPD